MKRILALLFLPLAACQPALDSQPRFGIGSVQDRVPVEGTRPFEARAPEKPAWDEKFFAKGASLYKTQCAVCHGATGEGDGLAVQRGAPAPPTFHDDGARFSSSSEWDRTLRRGKGRMRSFAGVLDREDRAAVIAYVRALQLSRCFPAQELTAAERERLDRESR